MKVLIAGILSVVMVAGIIDSIATVNRLKKEAELAYKNGDYATAVAHYQTLVDSLNVEDDNIRLNLAHSLIQAGDTISAQRNYSSLVRSNNTQVKSIAYQQMGIISSDQQKYEEALSTFKEALKANPTNEEARYNYELVKELLEKQQEQQEQQQDQQNQDQQEQQEQNQEQQQQQQDQQQQQGEQGEQSEDNQEGQQQEQEREQQGESEQNPQDPNKQNAQQGEEQQEGEKSDEEQSASPISERLKEMNISEEKARMILEAMRNNEMQYIQQNRRRPEKPRDRTKPDW